MVEILSVSELTLAIKKQLEGKFAYVAVKGEISNFKEQSSGHLYFTLKDSEAQISAVFFKGSSKGLVRAPKAGDQVIVKGELTVYPPRGNYQIIVRELQYAGIGELLLKLHELKLKLHERGWFDKARKRALPKFPRTIGVVTSPTGSVIQDILHILSRRFSGFHLILNPVRVQGEGAAEEIAQAIAEFNQYGLADVLIVGRGGGSLEDLWAFNEEIVAKAIFESKIPIISAVGHETDHCIADYVADVRAPTPSAAAEIVIQEKTQQLSSLLQSQQRLKTAMKQYLVQKRLQLFSFQKQTAALKPTAQIIALKQRLSTWDKAVKTRMQQLVQEKKKRLSQLIAHLKAIDPKNLLTKGYSIVFHEKNNSVILTAKELQCEDRLRILMHEGSVGVKVQEIL